MRISDLLGNPQKAERRFLTVKTRRPYPTFFYKYRTGNESFLDSIILDSQIWLSSRTKFNDPMDIVFKVKPIEDEAVRRNYFARICAENGSGYLGFLAMWSGAPTAELEHVLRTRVLESIADQVGVYSLSETARSLLMWAHYANSHQGISLQFYLPAAVNVFRTLMPVAYGDNITTIAHEDRHQTILNAFKTKSKEWHYEQEWRLLLAGQAESSIAFPAEMLKGVIYGARCPAAVRARIQNLIDQRVDRGLPPLYQYQAVLSKEHYHVGISTFGAQLPAEWTGRATYRAPWGRDAS